MFKANIIEDKEYYRIRSAMLFNGMFFPLMYVFLAFILRAEYEYIRYASLVLFIAIELYLGRRLVKMSMSFFGKRKLILDFNRIQIISQKKDIEAEYIPAVLDSIRITSDLNFTKESMWNYILDKEKRGHQLELVKDETKQVILFEFDSFYMIEQLKKVIRHWKVQNINVELIDPSNELA